MMDPSYVKNASTLPISPQAKITNLSHTPMPKKFGDFFESSVVYSHIKMVHVLIGFKLYRLHICYTILLHFFPRPDQIDDC